MEKFKIPNRNEEKTILKTFRIKYTTLTKLEELSQKSDISVNRLVNECIEYALLNLENDNKK